MADQSFAVNAEDIAVIPMRGVDNLSVGASARAALGNRYPSKTEPSQPRGHPMTPVLGSLFQSLFYRDLDPSRREVA